MNHTLPLTSPKRVPLNSSIAMPGGESSSDDRLSRLEDLKSMAIATEDYERASLIKARAHVYAVWSAVSHLNAPFCNQDEIDQVRHDAKSSAESANWQGPTIDALERRLAHLRECKHTAVTNQDYDMAEEYRVRLFPSPTRSTFNLTLIP